MIIPAEVTAIIITVGVLYIPIAIGWYAIHSDGARSSLDMAENWPPDHRIREEHLNDAQRSARLARYAPLWPIAMVLTAVRAARSAGVDTRAIADGRTTIQQEHRERQRQQEIDRLGREVARLRDQQEGDR